MFRNIIKAEYPVNLKFGTPLFLHLLCYIITSKPILCIWFRSIDTSAFKGVAKLVRLTLDHNSLKETKHYEVEIEFITLLH